MRKINEKDYKDFTIAGKGWQITLSGFFNIWCQWKDCGPGCTLYGNKPDGSRAIIDSK